MPIFAVTQMKGGVGATTLAVSLTNLWPNQSRILVELGITGGELTNTMGFSIQPPASPKSLTRDGFDFGADLNPVPSLSDVPQDEWELPVMPAPAIPDFPHPGDPMWWQKRVDLITQTNLDVIADLGRIAPEHLGIHNRVLNAAIAIIAVVRNLPEAKAAVSRLAMYQDRLAIVMISKLRSLPEEITEATGCTCFGVLPFDDAIASNTWRNILVTPAKTKSVKNYLDATTKLAITLGDK